MWHERAAYGHFFYRIPNGESAADAYDRVSGFNESLWRQFEEEDFPSVLVLVTHGLMTRVFLMKWYHYSVEYFEDLRNVEHCEFVVMGRQGERGKFELQTPLRTWSGLGRVDEEKRYKCPPVPGDVGRRGAELWGSRKYGGCVGGCTHPPYILGQGEEEQEGGGEKEKVIMAAGRDFGGSRSGCASRDGSDDDECTEPSDMLERVKAEQMKMHGQVLGDGDTLKQ